jgi:exodeoxyribonuclease V beta subunit
MSVPDNFIPGTGPNLVEASAGTGKTTWMVRTAVRLLLQDDGLPPVARPERLLGVTFMRAATAELKERIRLALQLAKRIRDGAAPEPHELWMQQMLRAGGEAMSQRLDATLASIDRLAVTTIHGFCKGALEEFALECGVPVGLRFIEQDQEYREQAVADEWRALTWEPGPVSHFVMTERMSGDTKKATRWSPDDLARAAKVVRQGIGAERPQRIDREAALEAVHASLRPILTHWDETRLRSFRDSITWNKGGITVEQMDKLCTAMHVLSSGQTPVIADIARWSTSSVTAVSHKTAKINKQLIPGEKFLTACEAVRAAYDAASASIWQDVVLSVAERMEQAMERDRVAGFDEMIAFLQRALTHATTGPRLREVLSQRYDAVLVDEFQDTDWAQWSIFSTTFGLNPLVLVGDPKQSIFGFRGADITAYRDAQGSALALGEGRVLSLDTNYRTDQALVQATEILFTQTQTPFDVDKRVLDFERVTAARAEPTLIDNARRPMVLVDLQPDNAPEQEAKITRFIAAEVARLLRDPSVQYFDSATKAWRRLKTSDIAILVSANRQAVPLLNALHAHRVPAVSGATGDITDSAMWQDVLLIISAIENPASPSVVRRALSTSIGGYTAREIAALGTDERTWRQLVDRFAEAGRDWASYGVLPALTRLSNEWDARNKLAAYRDGERRLTDFRHILSLLQEGEREGHRNPTMLLSWAHAFAAESDRDAEYRQQHLESDAEAVTVNTVHVAKGREWPVVFCGYLWKGRQDKETSPRIARFADGSRKILFGEKHPDELDGDSELSESLRLAYVALTRARSRTYVVWATGRGEGKGAIHHLLNGVGGGGATPAQALAGAHPEIISRLSEEDLAGISEFPESDGNSGVSALASRSVGLAADQTRSWSVSSYSRFTQGLKLSANFSEAGPVDETEGQLDDSERANQLPGGAHTGNALHELFERFDFTTLGDTAALDQIIRDVLSRYALPRPGADVEQRAAAIDLVRRMTVATLSTPIPGAALPLAAVGMDRTLREWRFNLSMAHVSPTRIATVFKEHGETWLAESYAEELMRVSRADIDGFLTGVVDLVTEIDGRWWIVDWKSNTLGAVAASYDVDTVRRVMVNEHYVLQYHIYVVALHRFLRSRLGDRYDYARDFGGVGYAFLRGLAMGAPAWFTDRPSPALVDALDACIGGYAR